MATVIDVPNMRHGYYTILQQLMLNGQETSPRGMKTIEVLNPTIVVRDPADTLPLGVGRNVSRQIAAVEAVQLCGSFASDELPVAAARQFQQFRETNGKFHGAYGRRIGQQAQEVVYKLGQDPDTRQAVITLWDPNLDNLGGKRDYPCTVSLQFLVRGNELLLSTNMRSNDVWLGLTYDIFQFSQLQWTVANMLGIEAGPLTHRPVSLHAYENDLERIDKIDFQSDAEQGQYRGFRSIGRAWHIGHGEPVKDVTATEQWFVDVLGPLLDRVNGDN